MMKRLRWLVVVCAVFGLIAASCGDDAADEPDAAPSDAAPSTDDADTGEAAPSTDDADTGEMPEDDMMDAEPLRAAVVTPSAENDLAFSQSIVDALHRLEEAGLLSEVAITPGTFIVEDAGVALRDYAEDGYDLVIGHGSQYGALIQEIAPDFPDTAFAWGTAADTFGLPNVSAYTAASNEGGYAMGRMAAALADGSPVGIIGPIEVGDAKLYVDGFAEGVASGGGVANSVYTDSFADVALAAEAATSFIGNGHAVLTGTAQMTVGAIGAANDSGVPWFGTQSNQTQVAPDVVVASQVYKWDVVLDDLVRDIQSGQMGGDSYEINFANGGLVIEYNDAYNLPEEVRAIGDAAVAQMVGEAAADEMMDAEPLRAAVVTPSAENDLAFSQSIVDALHRLEEAGLLSEVAITPGTFIVEDAGVALRDYAEDGYDLVIGHGSQYGALIQQIAPDFPDTAFAWGTAVNTFDLANVSAYTSASDEGGYAMGLAAAVIAGDSPVGIIGPIEVGDAKLYVDGFTAGVEAGGGTANSVYTDSFADVALAAESATSFIGNGHAVLTGTAQMTVGAIGVANDNGVPWFGTQSNQTQVAPDVVVANQVYKWDLVLDDLVRDIQSGQMGGDSYEINFANGGLVIEYNDAYDLSDEARAALDAAVEGLINGSLTTGIG